MITPTIDASSRFKDLYTGDLEPFLIQVEHHPVPELFNDLEILMDRVAQIVAGLMMLQPEKPTDRELFFEVFNKLIILESGMKEYYHQREAFLSVVQQFDLFKIAAAISVATIHHHGIILNYGQPQ